MSLFLSAAPTYLKWRTHQNEMLNETSSKWTKGWWGHWKTQVCPWQWGRELEICPMCHGKSFQCYIVYISASKTFLVLFTPSIHLQISFTLVPWYDKTISSTYNSTKWLRLFWFLLRSTQAKFYHCKSTISRVQRYKATKAQNTVTKFLYLYTQCKPTSLLQ